jgi:hypothetical protein
VLGQGLHVSEPLVVLLGKSVEMFLCGHTSLLEIVEGNFSAFLL